MTNINGSSRDRMSRMSLPGPPRILGIDPGLQITGYGVIEAGPQRPVVVEAGVVRGTDRARRMRMQHAMLRELGLPTLPEPADFADALAVALGHYYAIKLVSDAS